MGLGPAVCMKCMKVLTPTAEKGIIYSPPRCSECNELHSGEDEHHLWSLTDEQLQEMDHRHGTREYESIKELREILSKSCSTRKVDT